MTKIYALTILFLTCVSLSAQSYTIKRRSADGSLEEWEARRADGSRMIRVSLNGRVERTLDLASGQRIKADETFKVKSSVRVSIPPEAVPLACVPSRGGFARVGEERIGEHVTIHFKAATEELWLSSRHMCAALRRTVNAGGPGQVRTMEAFSVVDTVDPQLFELSSYREVKPSEMAILQFERLKGTPNYQKMVDAMRARLKDLDAQYDRNRP